jgi:O-antigen/teichoic acid export membrane protein
MIGAVRRAAMTGMRSRSFHNAGFLLAIQVVNLLVQIVTLPFLVRALGPDSFGRYAFFQAIAQFFILFVDFGFQLIATARVAALRDDRPALDRYFWTVQYARVLLALAAILIAAFLGAVVFNSPVDLPIFAASVAVIVGTAATPIWLFSGLERMGLVCIAAVTARLSIVPATILLVHQPGDAWLAAAIISASSLLAGLIALLLIARGRMVSYARPRLQDLRHAYADAWHVFLSNGAISLYLAGNTVMLGTVASPAQVGLFGAADKIRQFASGPITPLAGAFYPRVSRLLQVNPPAAADMLNRLLWGLAAMMGIVSLALFAAAEPLARLLIGREFAGAVPVLRILAVLPLVAAFSTVLGTLTMIPLGLKKSLSQVTFLAGLVSMLLVALLGDGYGAVGAATAFVTTEIMVTLLLFLSVRSRRIFHSPLRRPF